MKAQLLILTIFISFNVLAQRIEHKADSLKRIGRLEYAIKEYKSVLKDNPNDRRIIYQYTRALALNRQTDSAFHYLKVFITTDSSIWAIREPDFYFLVEDKRWEEIETILMKNIEKKYKFTFEDPELTKELWRMDIKQMAYFYHINIIKKTEGENSSILQALEYAKEKIDSQNVQRLEEIINKKGWPKKSIIKGAAASTVFSIVYNADYSIQKKFFPLIEEAANKEEASLQSLAHLIDRINLFEGKQQIYGTQFVQKDDGSWYLKDLFEPEYVNQRRKKVELQPIDEELFMYGIYWNFNQKEK